jgi:pantothenate kinase
VLADEKPVAVFPRVDELRDVLIPLLDWCVGRRPSAARGIVGIAAPCGAGKTLLLSWLAATARGLGLTQFAFAALDGYHFPNAVLDSRSGIDPEGNLVPLRLLKGTPPTFDVDSFLADLRAVKSTHQELHLPMYSRRLHEPVAGCIKVGPEVEWVFVEGNFLFLEAHFSRTDGPNISLIRAHALVADVFFRWGRDGHLKEVESAHSIET